MIPNSPAARLFSRLFSLRSSRLVEQVAGEVARACQSSLWRRMSCRTVNMSLAEIRGYVRAQAAECVGREAEQVISRRHLRRSLRRPLIDAAMDQLVAMISHDVLCGEMPTCSKTLAA